MYVYGFNHQGLSARHSTGPGPDRVILSPGPKKNVCIWALIAANYLGSVVDIKKLKSFGLVSSTLTHAITQLVHHCHLTNLSEVGSTELVICKIKICLK